MQTYDNGSRDQDVRNGLGCQESEEVHDHQLDHRMVKWAEESLSLLTDAMIAEELCNLA